jgi:outer membrane protein assembly factor BamE (lipoprotein component of BamABCDE complex)
MLRKTFRGIPLTAPAALALAAVILGACAANVDQRGNLPEAEKLAQIRPGSTTRDQVAKILGTPSSTGIFDDKRWYYISRKTSQVAFFDPDVLDQQVYIVNFDGKGVVRAVEHKNLADGREIEPAPGATPAPGRELTLVEQVLGNIGRFNKSSSKGEGGGDEKGPGPRPTDKPGS